MKFDHLGPLLRETRTPAVCHICNDYIYKMTYYDETSKDKTKVVFVCKNCIENGNNKKSH